MEERVSEGEFIHGSSIPTNWGDVGPIELVWKRMRQSKWRAGMYIGGGKFRVWIFLNGKGIE